MSIALRGYEMGAVDYVPVPVVPAVLRAKVKVFAELYRKTRQLERLNAELERRVERAHRGARSVECAARCKASRAAAWRSHAGQMGSWDFDHVTGDCMWDEGQHRIFGVDRATLPGDHRRISAPWSSSRGSAAASTR